MADHHNDESPVEEIVDKIHDNDSSSSSSDSGDEKITPLKTKVNRLFGREKPVHALLGGGNPAEVFLWKDKKLSAGVLGVATAIWVLFDVLEYHLLTLICHALILGLVIVFLWSNASTFMKKSPPHIPKVIIPEEPTMKFASCLRIEINHAFAILRDIASGKDLKKFLTAIAGLWVLSFLGSCSDLLTLLYTITVMLFTIPLFYEKYEDKVDFYAEKALAELKKQYAVFDAKVLSKIPKGQLKGKKSE